MAAVQTSYSERQRKAVAGMIANMDDVQRVTRICATAAGIGFGLAVSDSTGRKDAVLGGALTSFLGATIRDNTLVVRASGGDVDEYQQYENMGVLRQGSIWVTAGAAVARGDAVNYNATTGVFSNTGGNGPILGARWEEGAAAGEVGIIYLPGYAQS